MSCLTHLILFYILLDPLYYGGSVLETGAPIIGTHTLDRVRNRLNTGVRLFD